MIAHTFHGDDMKWSAVAIICYFRVSAGIAERGYDMAQSFTCGHEQGSLSILIL